MLASGSEPLTLADGTVINPEDGAIMREEAPEVLTEVPNNEQLQREVVAARVRISELPVPSEQMNTISVVMCYSLYGVTEDDIATITGLTGDQIRAIKISDPYTTIQNSFIENIIASDKSEVRDLFVNHSFAAANKVRTLMDSNSEAMQLAASKDILDRAGQRPVDVVEHRHKVEGGLTIEYVKQDNELPLIDVTPEI